METSSLPKGSGAPVLSGTLARACAGMPDSFSSLSQTSHLNPTPFLDAGAAVPVFFKWPN